jgi:ribosomal protein L7/L12
MTIMTTMNTVLNFWDFFVIGMIVLCFAGAAYAKGPDVSVQLLALQVRDLQKKLDALLKHQGVEMPPPPASGLSPELERLASLPDTKIAAIKLYRQENPRAGLREAKEKIEAFYKTRQ